MSRNQIVLALACPLWLSVSPAVHAQTPTAPAPPVGGNAVAMSASSPSSGGTAAAARPITILDADHFYNIGEFDEAAAAYNSLIAAGNDPALSYAGLARVYLKEHRASDAAAAANRALELAPTYPAVRTTHAEVLFRQGHMADAEHEFAPLVRANSGYARAYLGLARVYEAASYYKQAKRMIDAAHERDPDDPDIRRFWLHTLSRDERIQALHEYLSSRTNDDSKGLDRLAHELAILEDEASQPVRACRLTSNVASVTTDFKQLLRDPKHLRAYGLNVKFNGNTSANLLLDTGAGGIVVDRKIAERAGIRKVVKATIGGIGDKGDANGYVGFADSIRIGELEFHDCYVEVIERKSALDEDGLIGADVFSRFLIDLDFSNGKFRLSELPRRPEEPQTEAALVSHSSGSPKFYDRYIAPDMKSYTPVYRFGHMLLLWTQVGKEAQKLFLLDSGAFGNTISPAAAREVTKVYGDSDTTVKGLSGKVNDVFRGNDVTLAFGHLRQENQDIVAFDLTPISDSIGAEVSGTLGFTLLRMLDIKIDYRDGLVDLEFDNNRWQ